MSHGTNTFIYIGKLYFELDYWIPYVNKNTDQRIIITRRERKHLYKINEFDEFIAAETIFTQKEIDQYFNSDYQENTRVIERVLDECNTIQGTKIYFPNRKMEYLSDTRLYRPVPNTNYLMRQYLHLPPYNAIIANPGLQWSSNQYRLLEALLHNKTGFLTHTIGHPKELHEMKLDHSPSCICNESETFVIATSLLHQSYITIAPTQGAASFALYFKYPSIIIGKKEQEIKYTEILNTKRKIIKFIVIDNFDIMYKKINQAIDEIMEEYLPHTFLPKLQPTHKIKIETNRAKVVNQ